MGDTEPERASTTSKIAPNAGVIKPSIQSVESSYVVQDDESEGHTEMVEKMGGESESKRVEEASARQGSNLTAAELDSKLYIDLKLAENALVSLSLSDTIVPEATSS